MQQKQAHKIKDLKTDLLFPQYSFAKLWKIATTQITHRGSQSLARVFLSTSYFNNFSESLTFSTNPILKAMYFYLKSSYSIYFKIALLLISVIVKMES